MKKIIIAGFILFCAPVMADQYVNGHYKSDGTYVQGYYRTTPNNNNYDNYSTKGNTNPYTGQQGTQNPYLAPPPTPQYYPYPQQPRR